MGEDGMAALPVWMQIAVTITVMLFAAGTGIWGYVRKSNEATPSETVGMLRQIADNTDEMLKLIRETIELNRVERAIDARLDERDRHARAVSSTQAHEAAGAIKDAIDNRHLDSGKD